MTIASPLKTRFISLMGIDYFLLSFVIYWGAADSYFRGDDFFLLFPLNWSDFKAPWFGSFVQTEMIMPFYRPVFSSVFGVLFELFEWNPVGYHVVALSLHAAVCYIFFLFLQRLGLQRFYAWCGSLVFLLLPSHTQLVVHLINLAELLWVFLGLAGLFSLILWNETHRYRWMLIHVICVSLALGSKEGAISLPLLWLVVCWYTRKPGQSLIALVGPALPSFVILGAYLLVRGLVFGTQQGYTSYLHGIKAVLLLDHLLLRISSLFLSPSWGTTIDGVLSGKFYFPLFLIVMILVVPRWIKFAVIWMIISFIPYLTYPVYAERFSYAAALSVAVLGGFMFQSMGQSRLFNRFVNTGLVLLILIPLLLLTLYRVNVWYSIAYRDNFQAQALRAVTGPLKEGTILTLMRAEGRGFDDFHEFRPKPMLTIFPEMYRYPTFFDILRVRYYHSRVSFIPASSFLFHDFPFIEQHYIFEERITPDNHVFFHRVDVETRHERDAYLSQMRNR